MCRGLTWADEEEAQKPCCCLLGSTKELDPHIPGQAEGEAPSGELPNAMWVWPRGPAGLPAMPAACPLLAIASSARSVGASAAAALAAEAEASCAALSRATEEDARLMALGVLGSDAPCNAILKSLMSTRKQQMQAIYSHLQSCNLSQDKSRAISQAYGDELKH